MEDVEGWWGSIVFGAYVLFLLPMFTNTLVLLHKSWQVLPLCLASLLLMFYYAVFCVSFLISNQDTLTLVYRVALPAYHGALSLILLAQLVLFRRVKLPGSSSFLCWICTILTTASILSLNTVMEAFTVLEPQSKPTSHLYSHPNPYGFTMLVVARWLLPVLIFFFSSYLGILLRFNSNWYKRKHTWFGICLGSLLLLGFQAAPHDIGLIGKGCGEIILVLFLTLAEGFYRIERIQWRNRFRAKTIVARESNAVDWGLGEPITPMSDYFSGRSPRRSFFADEEYFSVRAPLTPNDALAYTEAGELAYERAGSVSVQDSVIPIGEECGSDAEGELSPIDYRSYETMDGKQKRSPSELLFEMTRVARADSIPVIRGGAVSFVRLDELDEQDGI